MAIRTKHDGLQIAGFCSGIGMLETALETALSVRGVPAQSCYHCEWEACTAAVLRRFIVASGGESLIHGNMFAADCSGLRGKSGCGHCRTPLSLLSLAPANKKATEIPRAWGENFNPADESTWGPSTPLHSAGRSDTPRSCHHRERSPIPLRRSLRSRGGGLIQIGLRVSRCDPWHSGKCGRQPQKSAALSWQSIASTIFGQGLEKSESKNWPTAAARCEGRERREAHTESRDRPHLGQLPNEELGDSNREARRDGSSRRQNKTGRRGFRSTETSTPLPIHAPGIDNFMAWSAVAKLDPAGMPSIESGVSVVATGLPSPTLICSGSAGIALMRWKRQLVSAVSLIAGLRVAKKNPIQPDLI